MSAHDEATDYQIVVAALNEIRWRCTKIENAWAVAHRAMGEIHDRAFKRLRWLEGYEDER